MGLYRAIRPLAFAIPPETAHAIATGALRVTASRRTGRRLLEGHYGYDHPMLTVECLGHTVQNPVGVAAGFDKNAEVPHGLAALGFGFVEVGTVTPSPQSGNDRPRLFRLPDHRALINRMGLNGGGMDRVADRLERLAPLPVPLGVNIGPMNDAAGEEALEQYELTYDRLAPLADYVVVNVSCPNTPGSVEQDDPDHLRALFERLATDSDPPLLVKIGPDSPEASVRELLDIVTAHDVAGVVATNTTTTRPGRTASASDERGGLSGRPLASLSTRVIRTVAAETDLPIIGVGGVDSAERAYEKIRAGASLVQLYTGLIYEGPAIAGRINRGLVRLLEEDGFESVEAAVGVDAP